MPGRHKNRKQLLPVLSTLLVFMLVLTGCGRAIDTSGLSRKWVLDRVESGNIALPDETVRENMLLLRLDPDGSGQLSGGMEEGRILWSYEQGTIRITAGNVMLSGSVDGDALLLNTADGDTVLRFVPDAGSVQSSEALSFSPASYLGDWYGWWKIEDSTGLMPVSWYDCCASFEQGEDGVVRFIFWDEDGSRTEPLSSINFRITEEGTLSSLNGYFDSMEIRRGDWSVSVSGPELFLSDIQYDAEREHFTASIYLRPWGNSWEDTEDGQKPFYYYDWYLPLTVQNKTMPERIPWQDLEAARAMPGKTADETSDRS